MSKIEVLQKNLYNFLREVDDRKKVSYCDNWGACLSLIDIVEEEYVDDEFKKAIYDAYARQLELNKYKEPEWLNLLRIFEENDIKVVNFKGLSLAYDLYQSIDYRKSNDIDILILEEDVPKVLSIVDENGYVVKGSGKQPKEMISEYVIDKKDILKEMKHIKPVVKFVDGKRLQIDIHINANKQLLRGNFVSFYDNSIPFNYKGHNIYVLELHDRIINLAGHFKEHFDSDANRFLGDASIPSLTYRFGQLYDIVLLLEKYRNKIDWIYLKERSKELGQTLYVAFALKMLSFVYSENDCKTEIKKIIDDYIRDNNNIDTLEKMDQLFHFLIVQEWDNDIIFKPEKFIVKALKNVVDMNPKIDVINNSFSEPCEFFNDQMTRPISFSINISKDKLRLKLQNTRKERSFKIKIALFNLNEDSFYTFRRYIEIDYEKMEACIDYKFQIECDFEENMVALNWSDILKENNEHERIYMCVFVEFISNNTVEIYKWPKNVKYMIPVECGELIMKQN